MKNLKKLIIGSLCCSMFLGMISPVTIQSNDRNVTFSESEEVVVDILKEGERSSLFNDNWKFYLGDISDAYEVSYNDASWENINLPHDYSITQEYTTSGEAESGFLLGGVGWYRKSFVMNEKYANKKVMIEFDGVYMDSTIYINGHEIGNHPYGYTPFAFDLSDYLICDGVTNNVIAIKVNHQTPSSRWYSGSGIYRDVYISVTDKIHVGYEGTYIVADVDDMKNNRAVDTSIETTIVNDTNTNQVVTVKNTLANTSISNEIEIQANSSYKLSQLLTIQDYELWSVDQPTIYQMTTEIMQNDVVIDTYQTDFGFRYFEFVRESGFSLNGKAMKLKGVCMHHDQGSLGAVANYAATYRQMKIMKDMGCNAIRVTHNPGSKVLIDICNELGLLVVEEAFDGWRIYKNGNVNDYSRFWDVSIDSENNHIIGAQENMTWSEFDLKAMINRDKNDPSIIMWSLGNEVFEGAQGANSTSQAYYLIARDLINWTKEIDTTRLVTTGDNQIRDGSQSSEAWKIANEIVSAGGIFGSNYGSDSTFSATYNGNPSWIMYGSECASAIHTRGWYSHTGQDTTNLQMSDYDNNSAVVGWGASASEAWRRVIEYDYNAGEFVWTGFDYLGEPTLWNSTTSGSISGQGAIPNSSFFGIVDTAGFPKDTYYLYQSLWNDSINTLHLIPHWNGDSLVRDAYGNVAVNVYTDAHRVELYLNDQLIDEASATTYQTDAGFTYQKFGNQFYPSFSVPYEEGTLMVKAYDQNNNLITDFEGNNVVKTSKETADLKISLDKEQYVANGQDLIYVMVDLVDEDGNFVANANDRVYFNVEGEGTLVGVDSGNPSDLDSRKASNRRALSGKVLGIVQTSKNAGDIKITASLADETSQVINVQTSLPESSNEESILSYEISKHVYVLKNTSLQLPTSLKATLSNGSSKEVSVTWDEIDQSKLQERQIFTIEGVIDEEQIPVSMNVHVLDEIAIMKSYAQSIAVDSTVDLPKTLPIVYYDGSLGESLPITWESVDESNFTQAGIVKVKGYANIFGTQYETTAYIQVVEVEAKENIAASTYEDSPTFTNGYMSNNTPTTPTTTAISDSLLNLNNGVTNDVDNTNERWTNWSLRNSNPWTYVQLDWNQKHLIGSVELWHFNDSAASEIPNDNGIYFEAWNEETSNWEKVAESHISIVSYLAGSTPYGFDNPVETNKLRIWLKASQSGKCVGLTEVKVYNHVEAIKPMNTLTIQDVTFDNVSMGYEANKQYTYEVVDGKMPIIDIITNESNKAITITPIKNRKQIVIVESEDESVRETFTILYSGSTVDKSKLQQLVQDCNLNIIQSEYTLESYAPYHMELRKAQLILDDTSVNQEDVDKAYQTLKQKVDQLELGIPYLINQKADDVSVVAFSSECNATIENDGIGSAISALDKNTMTYWHSNWENALGMPQYITIDLKANYNLNKINFLPRLNGTNGDVFAANIYVGTSVDNLTLVDNFTFEHGSNTYYDRSMKTIDLSSYDVNGRYVKFEVTSAGGDQLNQYCSISELEFYYDEKVDKSELAKTIQEINTIDQTLYTKKAIKNLALEKLVAQTIYDDEQATQLEVDAVNEKLLQLQANLALKQVSILNGGQQLEGYVFAGYFSDEACTIKTNNETNSYSKFVDEATLQVKAQIELDANSSQTIRFVSTSDSLVHQKVGFEISVNDRSKTIETTTVYNTIISNVNQSQIYNDPSILSYASNYFFTFKLINIPTSAFNDVITVKAYWITYDGTKVYGETREVSVNELIQLSK